MKREEFIREIGINCIARRKKAAVKEYKKLHPEKVTEGRKKYAIMHRDELNKIAREYRVKTPERHSAYKKNYTLKTYGLTQAQFKQLLLDQDYRCAICNDALVIKGTKYGVDHNHSTGQTRQILCRHCNCGLGFFRDNLGILQKAIDYLKKWTK